MKQFLILLVILSSCSQAPSKMNVEQGIGAITDTLISNSDSLKIPAYVIDQIIKHYNDTSSTMKADNSDSSVSVVWFFSSELQEEVGDMGTITDTSLDYHIEDTNTVISGDADLQSDYPSDIGGISQTIDFSKFVHEHVKGDINNDGNDDLIITVMVSGGGSAAWNEIFTFIFQNNRYMLSGITQGSKICGCSDGNFTPTKIVDGNLQGVSTCWTPEDGHCCPSLEYNTTVAFDGKGLKFVSNAKVK